MFQPSKFKQNNIQAMYRFIQNHSLATLMTQVEGELCCNHIPMIVIEKSDGYYLQGHVAKINNVWKDHQAGLNVMAVFQGPDAYISPNWYPSKKEHGKEVPTWNYTAVHVVGQMEFHHEKQWLWNHLDALSQHNEKDMPIPWKITDAPEDYINRMLGAIVGIEIQVSSISGKSKMSQNHVQANRDGVVQGLQAQSKDNVADWIKNPNMS